MREDERLRLAGTVRAWWSGSAAESYSVDDVLDVDEARLLDVLPTASRVLDVGCGAGRVLRELASRGHRVVGADVSAEMLARAAGLDAGLVRCDAAALPFADASFDAVVSWKVSCYVPSRAARIAFLDELARVLRPGGPVLLLSWLVPSFAEAADSLATDAEHRRTAAQYESLEPLDTFAAGESYVHWYTEEDLRGEIADSVLHVESFDRHELWAAVVLRR